MGIRARKDSDGKMLMAAADGVQAQFLIQAHEAWQAFPGLEKASLIATGTAPEADVR